MVVEVVGGRQWIVTASSEKRWQEDTCDKQYSLEYGSCPNILMPQVVDRVFKLRLLGSVGLASELLVDGVHKLYQMRS